MTRPARRTGPPALPTRETRLLQRAYLRAPAEPGRDWTQVYGGLHREATRLVVAILRGLEPFSPQGRWQATMRFGPSSDDQPPRWCVYVRQVAPASASEEDPGR